MCHSVRRAHPTGCVVRTQLASLGRRRAASCTWRVRASAVPVALETRWRPPAQPSLRYPPTGAAAPSRSRASARPFRHFRHATSDLAGRSRQAISINEPDRDRTHGQPGVRAGAPPIESRVPRALC